MTQEKLLDKLAKLKRHADSAKLIGNEKEAEAFAEMFQKLMLDHKINVSDIDFEQQEQDEPVSQHFINYAKYDVKLKSRRTEWIQSLASVVAEAHFCRILVHPGSSRITLVGRKSDCEVAEYVLVTLQRACEVMAKKAYYAYWFELFVICSRCGGQKDGHHADHAFVSSTGKAAGFKASWLDGFIRRLGERYRETRQGRAGESTALVRINRAEKAVIAWIDENVKKHCSGLQRHGRWNREGIKQGVDAANKLDLNAPKVVKAGAAQRKLA